MMADNRDSCSFCRIYDEKQPSQILYKDDKYLVFPDIKPAATHHYLVIPAEHIANAKQVTAENKDIVDNLVGIGKQVLEERGGDLSDVRFGFHWPPFNTISHLHLHVISPTSELSFASKMIFRPDSWWFVSPEYVVSHV